MLDKNIKLFKVVTGEMVIAKVENIETDENVYIVDMPFTVVPIPPERAGGAQNQVAVGQFIPFSDYNKEVRLNMNNIIATTDPEPNMVSMYNNWVIQYKAQKSGIVMPNQQQKNDILKSGPAGGFNKLNT